MPGISFLQAGFLAAGALAAALPILIHLLLRQRARVVEIGSVRFLKTVLRQHARRRRIRQWLLLALRVTALLLLGALFARPFLDRSRLEGLNREVVVLVDRSASMTAATGDGGTALESAWRAAGERIDALDENTAVRVALFDAVQVIEVPQEKLTDPPAASDASTDYASALSWARDVLVASPRANREVVLFTDLQKSGLDGGELAGLPGDVRVSVHDVGRAMNRNVGIEDARAVAAEIRPKAPVTVSVRLRNTGALPAKNVKVSLAVQGPQGTLEASGAVDVPAGQIASVAFPLDIQTPGIYRGEATHGHRDDLAFDDRRYVAFEARRPDRVLLVDGQLGRSVYANETYYLETALRLNAPTSDEAPRTYEIERIVWEDGEGFPDLTGFRALVLANLRRLTATDAQRLRDYTREGGSVVIFLGDQSTPAGLAPLREAGLAPATLAPEPVRGTFAISRWRQQHPLLEPFADPQHGDLRRLTFRKMHRLTNVASSAQVLVWSGDLPWMIEQPFGKGTVLFVATSADRDWSDWPQSRLYVPMVRQTLAYAAGRLGEKQTVRMDLVDRPNERVGLEQTEGVTWARNLDPRESLLARVTEDEFRRALGLPIEETTGPNPALAAQYAPAGAERPEEAWTVVVWMLLAVLACETLLASRVHG